MQKSVAKLEQLLVQIIQRYMPTKILNFQSEN